MFGNNKNGKILKVILVIVLIPVMLAATFYAIVDGIIGKVEEFVKNLAENVGGALSDSLLWIKKKLNIDLDSLLRL